LKKKGFKEERVTKVGLDAIGTSTTLESNKSHFGMEERFVAVPGNKSKFYALGVISAKALEMYAIGKLHPEMLGHPGGREGIGIVVAGHILSALRAGCSSSGGIVLQCVASHIGVSSEYV
jgi:hypothetical protein